MISMTGYTKQDFKIQEINFWMSPEECQTNTHYDGHHNILMIIHGRKSVELSPPGTVREVPFIAAMLTTPSFLDAPT